MLEITVSAVGILFLIYTQYNKLSAEFKALKEAKSTVKHLKKMDCSKNWYIIHVLIIALGLGLVMFFAFGQIISEEFYRRLYMVILAVLILDIFVEMFVAKDLQYVYYNDRGFIDQGKLIEFKRIKGYKRSVTNKKVQLYLFNGTGISLTRDNFKGLLNVLKEYDPGYKLQKVK